MIRLAALFWLVLVSATGFAMFAVKYEVQALDDDFAQAAKKAGGVEHEIRVLNAEWAYLNRPDALDEMNRRYLSLAPIATRQLRTDVADIPLRPTPPPVPPPVATVAAEPGAAEPGAAGAAATPQNVPPQNAASSRPAESAAAIVTAALDSSAAAREPARPVLIKAAARPSPPHRAASLDELIARIAAGRR